MSTPPDIAFLLAEIDRLKSWNGLMSLLNERYPADVITGESGDAGAMVVRLTREVDRLRDALVEASIGLEVAATFDGPAKEICAKRLKTVNEALEQSDQAIDAARET